MTNKTGRLALDLIEPGQAQKELHHNEALAALDLCVQASVVAAGTDDPPSAPAPGQCWIVGAQPTGGWTSQARRLAGWTDGGWRFADPREGMAVWHEARQIPLRFSRGNWEAGILRAAEVRVAGDRVVGPRAGAIGVPSGGATVDAEARATLTAILGVLRGHGLIAS